MRLYGAGDMEGAVKATFAALGGQNWPDLIASVGPDALDMAIRDTETYYRVEAPALRTGHSTHNVLRHSAHLCCPFSEVTADSSSKTADNCSIGISRTARTPTSSVPTTCCSCRSRRRSRSQSRAFSGDPVVGDRLRQSPLPEIPRATSSLRRNERSGYWIQQALANAGLAKPVITLVTQTLVDSNDPGFEHPTKFIGSGYPEAEARRLAEQNSWALHRDGDACRRGLSRPPHRVDTVVDKDFVAVLIATELEADLLGMLADVKAVFVDYGTPSERPLHHITLAGAIKPSMAKIYAAAFGGEQFKP